MYTGSNIVTDGLAFGYDTGYGVSNNSTSTRFYPGRPTVNVHPYPLDIYAQLPQTTSVRLNQERDTSVSSPLGGIAYKMTPTGADPYMETYNSSTYNLASAASGQTWTASVYVKANRATAASIFIFEANSSGAYTAADANTVNIGTDWQRISITRTFNQSNTAYVQARIDGPDTYAAGDILWFDGYQVEQQGNVTPFVNGTRSATASLIDLKRTTNIDMSNSSFDSTGQPDLDGAGDFIKASSTHSITGDITLEAIFNEDTASAPHTTVICTDTGYQYGVKLMSYKNIDRYGLWLGFGSSNHLAMLEESLSNNTMYHLVGSWDQSSGVVKIYLNGVLKSTISTGQTGAISLNEGKVVIGADYHSYSYGLNGNVYVGKVYNKVLTDDEVTQNYKAYKNRFNI